MNRRAFLAAASMLFRRSAPLELGDGDPQGYWAPTVGGRVLDLRDGSAAAPVTVAAPTLKVSRTERVTKAAIETAIGPGTDGSEVLPAISAISAGTADTEVQPIGVYALAKSASTSRTVGANHDASAVYAVGISEAGNAGGVGVGGFFNGARLSPSGRMRAMELACGNVSDADVDYYPFGASNGEALWINAYGGADSAAAVIVSNGFGRQFEQGIAFTGQATNGLVGGVRESAVRDDSDAQVSLDVNGHHEWGADLRDGTFAKDAVGLPNGQGMSWRNVADTADLPAARVDSGDVLVLGEGCAGVRFADPLGALTPADNGTVNTNWGTDERDVLRNVRTRLDEIEAVLRAAGLVG